MSDKIEDAASVQAAPVVDEATVKSSLPPPTLAFSPLAGQSTAIQTGAFKLVTDSQAQRQNLVNNKILFSTLTVSAFVATLSAAFTFYFQYYRDAGVLVLALAGICIAFLSLAGRISEPELKKAEALKVEDVIGLPAEQGKKFKNSVFVYRSNIVVGVITAVQEGKSTKTPSNLHITGWSTLRRYRGTGLGTDLLNWLLKNHKWTTVTVTTHSTETAANHILTKHGFKVVKARPDAGVRGKYFGLSEYDWELSQ